MQMETLCDFCEEARALVYCPADNARLCLSCDYRVHVANALSQKHNRTAICNQCNAQVASVQCEEDKLFLCKNCDSEVHETSSRDAQHNRQKALPYVGCPSAAELESIWGIYVRNDLKGDQFAQGYIPEIGSRIVGDIVTESAFLHLQKDIHRAWFGSYPSEESLECVVAGHQSLGSSKAPSFWMCDFGSECGLIKCAKSFVKANDSIFIEDKKEQEQERNFKNRILHQLIQLQRLQSQTAGESAGLQSQSDTLDQMLDSSQALPSSQPNSLHRYGSLVEPPVAVQQHQQSLVQQGAPVISLLLSELEHQILENTCTEDVSLQSCNVTNWKTQVSQYFIHSIYSSLRDMQYVSLY
eukprot:c21363_g1_i2 orf=206-1270(-)